MSNYELLTLVVQGVSSVFLALSVIYAARQLRSVQRTNSQMHDWYRRKAAQDMCVRFAEFNPNKVLIIKELEVSSPKVSITMKDLEKKFEKNIELRNAVHSILNYYEYLCLGIKQGIYDEDVVKKFWKNGMVDVYQMLRVYVLERRKDQETIWEYLGEYTSKWQHEDLISENRPQVA